MSYKQQENQMQTTRGVDPHGMAQHEAGAKLDAGKPPVGALMLSMPRALLAVSDVARYGADKYTPNGWLFVQDGVARYTNAMLRHVLQEGIEPHDEESGLLHAAQVAWNALARLELMLRNESGDCT